MKKVLFLLFLTPSFSWASITQAQLDQIKLVTRQMSDTITSMRDLASQIQPLIANGNAFACTFSTNTVSLSAQQQQDIVNYYTTLKNQLATEYSTLP